MQANFLLSGNPDSLTGYRVARIDGAKSQTLSRFYKEIAGVLEFPDYFGFNLDSLDELLNDLSWIKEEKILIFIDGSEHFIENEPDPERLHHLLVLLDETAGNWKNSDPEKGNNFPAKELKIVFSPGEKLKQLLRRLDIKYDVL